MQQTIRPTILVIDDDRRILEIIEKFLGDAGYRTKIVSTGEEGIEIIRRDPEIAVVLTDIRMPGISGMEALKQMKEIAPEIEVVMMTAEGSIESAVEAMKLGAADYLTKPFKKEQLVGTVQRAFKISKLQGEVRRLKAELHGKYRMEDIIGRSEAIRRLQERLANAARSEGNVLMIGESGTGKDLCSRSIHYNSQRVAGPFVPVNCAALPSELIESELFGYVKGAFTGANNDSMGLFRAADGGTLFLDEISGMPISTQSKLLRVLQEKKIRPIGGTEELSVDVRVIAATNVEPKTAIKEGLMREDLFYRLSVITVELPPLRDRPDDVPPLVEHFIQKFNARDGRQLEGVAPAALDRLCRYPWPGNVRELENTIESIFALGSGVQITVDDLPEHVAESTVRMDLGMGGSPDHVPTLAEAERELLIRAIKSADGNKSQAAQMLGVSRKRLYNMIERYDVDPRAILS